MLGEGPDLLVSKLDVTRSGDAETAVQQAVERFGKIDVLVNNAGISSKGFFEDMTLEQIRHQPEVDLIGPMNVTRAVLPVMRRQRSGHVISISSRAGLAFVPMTALSVLVNPITARIAARIGARLPIAVGQFLMAAGLLSLAIAAAHAPVPLLSALTIAVFGALVSNPDHFLGGMHISLAIAVVVLVVAGGATLSLGSRPQE